MGIPLQLSLLALPLQLSLLALVSHASATACGKAIIVFGDSLSDNGNFFNLLSNRTRPPQTAKIGCETRQTYFQGRFTNYPGVWNDHLKNSLLKSAVISNFAFGGAALCDDFPNVPIPHVPQQIDMYLNKLKTDKSYRKLMSKLTRIPTIFAGANDIQFVLQENPALLATLPPKIIQCLVNSTRRLLDSGEKQVVVATLPPLDQAPFTIGLGINTLLTPLIAGINAGIKQAVTQLNAAYKAQKKSIIVWDINTEQSNFSKQFKQLGFKFDNTKDCLNVPPQYSALRGSLPTEVCSHPDDFIFYDDLHPTSKAHWLTAQSYINTLYPSGLITKKDLRQSRRWT